MEERNTKGYNSPPVENGNVPEYLFKMHEKRRKRKRRFMLFESWLKNKNYNIKKLSRKQGRALWQEFKREMTPAVKDCSELWNATMEETK